MIDCYTLMELSQLARCEAASCPSVDELLDERFSADRMTALPG
jgi:hypothetical protein